MKKSAVCTTKFYSTTSRAGQDYKSKNIKEREANHYAIPPQVQPVLVATEKEKAADPSDTSQDT